MSTAAMTAIDPRMFRETMGRFATGVTVVSTEVVGEIHGMTANAFVSVSLDPPLVLISIGQRARMHQLLRIGQRFGISVLAADQVRLSDHFAGRPGADAAIAWSCESGTPLLPGALAHVVAEVTQVYAAGDHTLFIGHVEYVMHYPGQPLLFHAGDYARIER